MKDRIAKNKSYMLVGAIFLILGFVLYPSFQQPEKTALQGSIVVVGDSAQLIISPASNATISGRITITLTGVPDATKTVGYGMYKVGLEAETPNVWIADGLGSLGAAIQLDTKNRENGEYTIFAKAYPVEDPGPATPVIGFARARVVLNN